MLPDLDETKGAALGIVRLWSEYRQVNTFCIFSGHNIVFKGLTPRLNNKNNYFQDKIKGSNWKWKNINNNERWKEG